jgi:hypothetical protein
MTWLDKLKNARKQIHVAWADCKQSQYYDPTQV